MIAIKVYNIIADLGMCSTQVEFSREWLGASDRYFSHLLAKGRNPHMTALVGMAARLEHLVDLLSADALYAGQVRVLDRLIDEVWDDLRARAVAAEPKRRGVASANDALPTVHTRSKTRTAA